MAITINTNIAALNNQRALNKKTSALGESFDKLASGKLTKASQDAAGLAIALGLTSDAATGAVAARNISDGVSAASIADGAMQSASDITLRMQELSTQAANGTLSDQQRVALNNEYQALRSELDRVVQTTEFNGQQLLSGGSISVQAGTSGSGDDQIVLNTPEVSSAALGLTGDLLTQSNAQAALAQSTAASDSVASSRADLAADVNRLSTAFENIQSRRVNELEAASRIQDVDIASEASKLTANRIGQQVSAALAAQANQQPSLALRLLS